MTLRQIAIVFKAETARRHRQYELAYFGAYYSGVFSQTYEKGKFPKYNPPKLGPAKRQTLPWQQLKQAAMRITAVAGGEIVKR